MLNWKNLLNNKCPKCNKYLDFESDKDMMMCTIKCGFIISSLTMSKVCQDIVSGKLKNNPTEYE